MEDTGTENLTPEESVLYYFLDESGDMVLFDKRGRKVLVGNGASEFFILGKLDVDDPDGLSQELQQLRANLLADPYFHGVPSMQLQEEKTAIAFHAKDDLPEVRREVFQLLLRHSFRFYAVVRHKHELVKEVRARNKQEPNYRYRQNDLYDSMTRELFRKLRTFSDRIEICYANRGAKDRTHAFEESLKKAEEDFEMAFGFARETKVIVTGEPARNNPCLQAVDYVLWALQRHYEKKESRFMRMLWDKVGEIHDLDVRVKKEKGAFYTKNNPIWEGA